MRHPRPTLAAAPRDDTNKTKPQTPNNIMNMKARGSYERLVLTSIARERESNESQQIDGEMEGIDNICNLSRG
jgi:hypothetical protein